MKRFPHGTLMILTGAVLLASPAAAAAFDLRAESGGGPSQFTPLVPPSTPTTLASAPPDPATGDTADLVFSNDPDFSNVTAKVTVKHANTRGGVTFMPFSPVTARYVRWQGTAINLYDTVGGSEISFFVAAVKTETQVKLALEIGGQVVAESREVLKPVRPWVLYFLSHSHVDIGYTHVQTEVEKKQWGYLEQAIELARSTADYPPEARFKWNSEGLWAVDSYLKQASPEKEGELIEAVRKGWIELDALYGNELTGLCRPEELFRLVDCARRLSKKYDLRIESAMISDVPGYTWGIVPSLAHSGVKYFSIGPNHIHRIGYTLADWGDKPFYWMSPSGEQKVLFWMAGKA